MYVFLNNNMHLEKMCILRGLGKIVNPRFSEGSVVKSLILRTVASSSLMLQLALDFYSLSVCW